MTLICIGALLVVPELLKITHDALEAQHTKRRIYARLVEGPGPTRVAFTEGKRSVVLLYALLGDGSHALNLRHAETYNQWRFTSKEQTTKLHQAVDQVLRLLAAESFDPSLAA